LQLVAAVAIATFWATANYQLLTPWETLICPIIPQAVEEKFTKFSGKPRDARKICGM
jgi:hypothetical protein